MATKKELVEILSQYSDDAQIKFDIVSLNVSAVEPEPAEIVAPVEEVKAE